MLLMSGGPQGRESDGVNRIRIGGRTDGREGQRKWVIMLTSGRREKKFEVVADGLPKPGIAEVTLNLVVKQVVDRTIVGFIEWDSLMDA